MCLHTVKYFKVLLFNFRISTYQVFLPNTNYLHTVVWFHVVITRKDEGKIGKKRQTGKLDEAKFFCRNLSKGKKNHLAIPHY